MSATLDVASLVEGGTPAWAISGASGTAVSDKAATRFRCWGWCRPRPTKHVGCCWGEKASTTPSNGAAVVAAPRTATVANDENLMFVSCRAKKEESMYI